MKRSVPPRVSAPAAEQPVAPPVVDAARGLDVRFLFKASAFMGALFALFYYPYSADSFASQRIEAYLRFVASGSAWLIQRFDPSASAHGTAISGVFPLEIVKACSALDAQALFAGAACAFPARLQQKLWGLAAGVALLTLFNLLRIALLCFVGANLPQSFETVHEEVMPLLLVVLACGMFAWWARRVSHVEAAAA